MILNGLKILEQYAPQVSQAVSVIQDEVFSDGELSAMEKHLLLTGVYAARRMEDSMLYHTKEAIGCGASIEEIADILATCIISRGIPAWLTGVEAIKLAMALCETEEKDLLQKTIREFQSVEECIRYYEKEFETLPDWVAMLKEYQPDVLYKYTNLRNTLLVNHQVSRKLKELMLTAINVCDQYRKGINIHVANARHLGAKNKEIAEVSLLCLTVIGISGWMTGSSLIE
ncbi:carboxymuconolactone decarboxylase family protein [Bacillus sp. CRN 9]|nr:carboxymuconolactone decarboxylase family protein [Bacillus sp. CRN 9]